MSLNSIPDVVCGQISAKTISIFREKSFIQSELAQGYILLLKQLQLNQFISKPRDRSFKAGTKLDTRTACFSLFNFYHSRVAKAYKTSIRVHIDVTHEFLISDTKGVPLN